MKRINLFKISIVSIAFLSLQSCFVAKDYERPEAMVEANNYRTDSLHLDTLSMATLSWKELLTDPLLQNYIEEGLKNNIDIRVAIQQIAAAEAYLKQGKAGQFPTLFGNAQYIHQELSESSQYGNEVSALEQYQLSADLSWEADIWGKIRSNKRAFEASYLQTIAAHQAVKSRLISNIASNYYQLLALDEQIRITEETILNRQNSLETIGALKDAGIVTAVDVKQTEAQFYTAQAILVDLKNNSRLLENSLSILLGSAPHKFERSTLEMQHITTDLNIGVPAQLLHNRPDVLAAEYNLMNAFELTNVARSSFYPSLTISASGGLQSLELDKLFNANSLFASIVGGITQPILNGRKIKTNYEVSQALQEQALLNFKQSILNAGKEVSDALYNYGAATQKIEIREKEFDAYSTASSYSEELMDNGLANYLEVLTTRENSLNSSLGLVNARFEQLQAIVNLYEALGGGWR